MIDVVVGEGGHGEIAVIVSFLPPNIHFPLPLCRFGEILRQQLALRVEIVCCALYLICLAQIFPIRRLEETPPFSVGGRGRGEREGCRERGGTYDINKHIQFLPLPALHQLRRIMFRPHPLISILRPKIPTKRLLAPRAITRIRNGREGGDGSVFAGVLQKLRTCRPPSPLAFSRCQPATSSFD